MRGKTGVWATDFAAELRHDRIYTQMDGAPAGFIRGVLLRSWLLFFVQALPKLGPLLWLANHLAIFGPGSRCGHDRLAGTKVVKATRAP